MYDNGHKTFYSTLSSLPGNVDDANNPVQAKGSIDTKYSSMDTRTQQYPETIADDFVKRRTFYIAVDETANIDFSSNFALENLIADLTIDSQLILGKFQTGVSSDKYSGIAQVASAYALASAYDRGDNPYMKKANYVTSVEGVNIDVKINNEMTIPLRIVVYYK